jgi:hypothetical protein
MRHGETGSKTMSEDPLTDSELKEIESLCNGTTGGTWESFVEGRNNECGSDFIRTSGEDIELSGATVADQDFIANARQSVPRLVAEVRRLRARVDELETLLHQREAP